MQGIRIKFLLLLVALLVFSGCSWGDPDVDVFFSDKVPKDDYGSVIIVGVSHASIHDGKSWFNSDQVTLSNGASRKILLRPECPLDVHLDIQMRSTGETNFFLYEGVTVSNNGTFVQARNRNREFPDNNSLRLYINPTIIGGKFIQLDEKHFGSGQNTIGETRGFNEIILNCNETYLINITSEAAANDISYVIDWYEKTD